MKRKYLKSGSLFRTGAAALCLCLVLSLSGCRSGADSSFAEETEPAAAGETVREVPPEDIVYLSMATSGNWEDILRGDLWNRYCEKLQEWSDGRLVMRIYQNGALGNDLELIEGVQEGTLCIINSVPSYQISAVPEAALLDVPGMFYSTEEYNYFIDNYYFDTIQSYYQRKGLRLLSSSAFDFRVLTANIPVQSMEDMEGLKLRSMENKYHMAFWQAMGATVISMNFNQARLAIQQGILQAQENPLGYMISAGLQDVQDQVIRTNHVLMISNFVMNEDQYEDLSEENRQLLQRFFDEMNRELVEEQPQENEKLAERLRSEGISVYDASDDIREAVTEIGQSVVLDMLREDLGDDVVNDYLKKVAQAKAAYQTR